MDEHRVLIVDDDVDICHNVRDILEEFGYRTDMAHDGASAMKLVESERFDVALLDFKMPDTDGATLYEQIKKVQPSLVAIMITAYAGSDGVDRARNAGTWHVLRKPVDFEQLLDLIQQAANQPVVLLVDDDSEFCDNLWTILREEEIRVAIANNNDAAAALLDELDLQVVLLDIHLGTKLCTPVFEKLLTKSPMPPTLLITGDHETREFAGDLVKQGARDISFKPLDMHRVIAKIRSFLA
ncbi:MAG: response regulator [Planctomycetota bacterium]